MDDGHIHRPFLSNSGIFMIASVPEIRYNIRRRFWSEKLQPRKEVAFALNRRPIKRIQCWHNTRFPRRPPPEGILPNGLKRKG